MVSWAGSSQSKLQLYRICLEDPRGSFYIVQDLKTLKAKWYPSGVNGGKDEVFNGNELETL